MNCIICNASMKFYFLKHFGTYNLETVNYWKCGFCGFVLSRTHADLSDRDWEKLNFDYHCTFLGQDGNADDPRWLSRLTKQAEIINDLVEIHVLPRKKWLDFACGDGKLSDILQK